MKKSLVPYISVLWMILLLGSGHLSAQTLNVEGHLSTISTATFTSKVNFIRKSAISNRFKNLKLFITNTEDNSKLSFDSDSESEENEICFVKNNFEMIHFILNYFSIQAFDYYFPSIITNLYSTKELSYLSNFRYLGLKVFRI